MTLDERRRLEQDTQSSLRQFGPLIYTEAVVWTWGEATYPTLCSLTLAGSRDVERWGRTVELRAGDLVIHWAQGVTVPPEGSEATWRGRRITLTSRGLDLTYTGQPVSAARWVEGG